MKLLKKLAVCIASVFLTTLICMPITSLGKPVEAFSSNEDISNLSKVHPLILQQIKNNPEKVVKVIVGKKAGSQGVEEAAEKLGAKITSNWEFINAFAADVPGDKIAALAALPGVMVVNKDSESSTSGKSGEGEVDASIIENAYNMAVKADIVWEQGYYGDGVTIAVVDSGIASDRQDDFGERLMKSVRMNSSTLYASDKYGHGTHVAGIIAGNGDNSDGKYVGIAPRANLINVKFSDDNGNASESDLVDGLQWIYDHHEEYNIRVANISSTVSTQQKYTESAACAAVEQLWKAGIVVVVSAGNRGGEDNSTSYAPANDPFVISVGAVDDKGTRRLTDDFMKPWSSSGTTLDGFMKPDVVAPGAHIVSYMPGGDIKTQAPENIVDEKYFRMGGTSMAAPVVSGVVALMLERHPEWTPDQVKWILANSNRNYQNQPEGTPGVVDAEAAVFYDIEYGGNIGVANEGLTPSPFLDADSDTIVYDDMFWSNMFWSNMFWSNSVDK